MDNRFINKIIKDIRLLGRQVILLSNPDKFILRKDVQAILNTNNIYVVYGNMIQQRIAFELRNKEDIASILLLISDDAGDYLEDIKESSIAYTLNTQIYFSSYHLQTIINCELSILETLFQREQITTLSKKETEELVNLLKPIDIKFDIEELRQSIYIQLESDNVDWHSVIELLSNAILITIDSKYYQPVFDFVNEVNTLFQKKLTVIHPQSKTSNSIKHPKIVSNILDHISFKKTSNKLALIVVDGLSYWQYLMLKKQFKKNIKTKDNYTLSWLPSITQLSRQAIFLGKAPNKEYIQNPRNEKKLWIEYWKSKGVNDFEISYNHEKADFTNFERVSKYALVYSELDKIMHNSHDYADLKDLTENWLQRSGIVNNINTLLEKDFEIYLTTDHGNLPVKAWRRLTGREKLGANKSGSQSQRHIEYSDMQLADEFVYNNEELKEFIVQEERAIYLTNDLSFTTKESIVTHGGSHILEVLIPFIKIGND